MNTPTAALVRTKLPSSSPMCTTTSPSLRVSSTRKRKPPAFELAYEPVWAIGTGQVASPGQAEEVHADLRRLLAERYNGKIADTIRILYGGSVKPDNAGELLSQSNIDGALVGGASLKVDDFLGIALTASLA